MMPPTRSLLLAVALAVVVLLLALFAGAAQAQDAPVTTATEVASDWALLPSGLNVGDEFRLLIITSTTRDGQSTIIADYDTHVQSAVAAGHTAIRSHSSLFKAVGCTNAVHARDHTGTTHTVEDTGVAIYWLNGAKAADDYVDFYDGSWDEEAKGKNESGTDVPFPVFFSSRPFTGCDHDGTKKTQGGVFLTLGNFSITLGDPNTSGQGPLSSDTNSNSFSPRPFYGLSSVFRVAAANDAPTFTSSDSFSVAENTTAVGTVVAEDSDTGDAITGYSLSGGVDRAQFEITDEGELTFAAAPDYENPTDVLSTTPPNQPRNNEYIVEVTATSGAGDRAMTARQTITVTVMDEPEAISVIVEWDANTRRAVVSWTDGQTCAAAARYYVYVLPSSPPVEIPLGNVAVTESSFTPANPILGVGDFSIRVYCGARFTGRLVGGPAWTVTDRAPIRCPTTPP